MHLLTARLPARRAALVVLLGSLLLEPAVGDERGSTVAIPPPPRSTIAVPPAPPAQCCRVSVIGAVKYPATFESGQPLSLNSLITGAGGMTGDASGAIRVIRNNGDQPRLDFYQGLTDVSVSDGAVVVVEPRTDAARHAIGRDGAFVDVACLNLIDRPLVQWLPPAEASLPRLLERLGLPPTTAAGIRILAPGRSEAADTVALTPGMVLVFDRTDVDEAALHEMAARYPWQDLVPLEDVEPPPPRAEPQSSSRFQFLPNSAASAVAVPIDGPPEAAPVPEAAPAATGTDIVAASALQTAPAASPALFGAPQPPREPVIDQPPQRPSQAASRPADAIPSQPQAEKAGFPWWPMTWILAVSAALAVAARWAVSVKRRTTHGDADTAENGSTEHAAPLPRKQPLDELINNELPLLEEEATFPTGLTLHGRTVGFRYLIHGRAEEPRGPHFAPAGMRQHPAAAGAGSAPPPQPEMSPGPASPLSSRDEQADERAEHGGAASEAGGARPQANVLSPMERALLARRKGRPV